MREEANVLRVRLDECREQTESISRFTEAAEQGENISHSLFVIIALYGLLLHQRCRRSPRIDRLRRIEQNTFFHCNAHCIERMHANARSLTARRVEDARHETRAIAGRLTFVATLVVVVWFEDHVRRSNAARIAATMACIVADAQLVAGDAKRDDARA